MTKMSMTKTSKQAGTQKPVDVRHPDEFDAKANERRAENRDARDWPAAGPHSRRDLINNAATPGSGLFSDNSIEKSKVDPGAG